MATKRISALTAASSAALTDQIPIEDAANATKRLTLTQVFALAASSGWSWAGTHAFGAAVTMATTLGVTGAVALASTLSAQATTLASLSVTGDAGVGGNLAVNTNKFNVTASSGNTAIAGTLGVAGLSTLTGGAVAVAAPTSFGNYAIGGRKEYTNTSGNLQGYVSETVANPSGASSAIASGILGRIESKSANAQNMTSAAALSAFRADAAHLGSGAVTGMIGYFAPAFTNTGGGSVTATYGLYLSDQTVGTTNYGVYQLGASVVNYMAGKLGIGTASPARALDVVGTFGATGAATLGSTLAVTGITLIGPTTTSFTGIYNLGSRKDFTDLSGTPVAGMFEVQPAPASASTATFMGTAGYVLNSSANTSGGTLVGGQFDARTSTATGTVYGSIHRTRNTGAATIATQYGGWFTADNTGLGTVTTATAVLAQGVNSGGGTIGTFYGVRVPTSATLATTTWGVYIDAAKSYFGGGLQAEAPMQLKSYTLAGLPTPATWPRGQAWCSDHTGGARPVYSDGTNWRDYRTGSIAA